MGSIMIERKITEKNGIAWKSDRDIATVFDDYVDQYDSDLERWLYDAPEKAAKRLATRLPLNSRILDVGCGTGLVGVELSKLGFTNIDGIDISSLSLQEACRKGPYHKLSLMNLHDGLPLEDNYSYDGIICVGVLTYLEDIPSVLLRLIKLVRTGGEIELTQRSDMYKYHGLYKDLKAMVDAELISNLEITDPEPYLPKYEVYGEEVLVHYISFTVL
jgi:predicted TPR repeat methyltransferase